MIKTQIRMRLKSKYDGGWECCHLYYDQLLVDHIWSVEMLLPLLLLIINRLDKRSRCQNVTIFTETDY